MRLRVGPNSEALSRTLPAGTTTNGTTPAGTSTAPTGTAPVKLDLSLTFAGIQASLEPMTVQVHCPSYDPSTTNNLQALTAIAYPIGSGKPSDANSWITSGHPKGTVAIADPATTAAAAAAAAIAATAANPVSTTMPTGASIGGMSPTPPVLTPGVAATTVPTASVLPGPAGGLVTIAIPGVPAGKYQIQLIEGYDV